MASHINGLDDINAGSTWLYMLGRDTPARQWWDMRPLHPAVYRALGIDPKDYGAVYAVAPFRLGVVEGKARVFAAWPAPRLFDPPDTDWLNIETVIEWNPVDDTAAVVGEPGPQLVGAMSETGCLFSSPRKFFQQWAIRRAAFATHRQTAKRSDWHNAPPERDMIPGALAIGEIDKIHWRPLALPADIQCVGIDPKAVNRAILRSARLPRARAA